MTGVASDPSLDNISIPDDSMFKTNSVVSVNDQYGVDFAISMVAKKNSIESSIQRYQSILLQKGM